MTEENKTREEYRLAFTGSFDTEIVGIQYYKGEVDPGDEVIFERAPYNPYDDNAIEAHNKNDELAGHLPRNIAFFAAPLVDDGLIFLKGNVTGDGDKWRKPLKLDVFTTVKGGDIFSRKIEPEFGPVVHNHVADIYEHWGEYSASLLESLTGLYRSEKLELLPETRLLVHILKGKAEEKRLEERHAAEMILKGFVETFSAGEPLHYHNITIVPIFRKSGVNDDSAKLVPLCNADLKYSVKTGSVKDQYVLHVKNLSDEPVLITRGECPPLSEQGIMIRRSTVIAPDSEADLNFYRLGWNTEKIVTSAAKELMMASPSFRCIPTLSSDKNKGDEENEQHLINEVIDDICATSGVDGGVPYRKLWEMSGALLSGEEFPPPADGAAGYAFFQDDDLLSCDLFSDKGVAFALFLPLLKGVIVSCGLEKDEPPSEIAENSIDHKSIVETLLNDKTEGEIRFADNGSTVALKRDDSSVTVLLYKGTPVHAVLWKYKNFKMIYDCYE